MDTSKLSFVFAANDRDQRANSRFAVYKTDVELANRQAALAAFPGLIWPLPDHSRITHSRHQTVLSGHGRTRRQPQLSSRGLLRVHLGGRVELVERIVENLGDRLAREDSCELTRQPAFGTAELSEFGRAVAEPPGNTIVSAVWLLHGHLSQSGWTVQLAAAPNPWAANLFAWTDDRVAMITFIRDGEAVEFEISSVEPGFEVQ